MNESTTPNPTPEQILVDEWIRQADRAKSMTGMDAIWFPDAKETLAALRAHGLLSEGAPSDEQIERAARAFFREYHGEDILPELRDDGELDTRSRALAATRVALTAAGVAPQEPSQNETKSGNNFVSLDPEKVADVLRLAMRAEAMMFEYGGYEWVAESDPDDCLPHIAHALCEAYTEGKLTK